jgi:hypothetical protein
LLKNEIPHEIDGSEEARKISQKLQQNKMTVYLASITEQRKKEEEEKRKKEDREKKRMLILSNRLLQESNERKLMALNDSRSGIVSCIKVNSESKHPTKITSAMAESIANRLNAKPNISNEVSSNLPIARDFSDWKRKNNVPVEGKVFGLYFTSVIFYNLQ